MGLETFHHTQRHIPGKDGLQRLRVDAIQLLEEAIREPQKLPLGQLVVKNDIPSFVRSREDNQLYQATFQLLPEYVTRYPDTVINALGHLYAEYNLAFGPLVNANKEWPTDYQFSMSSNGTPINSWIQIDMVGLPEKFLQNASNLREEDIVNVLRGKIFEIENSLARNAFMERIFSRNGEDSSFKRRFRASLDDLRQRHGKKIALLAVTEQKYLAMKETEFGTSEDDVLTDEYVKQLTGFDTFFAPKDFKKHLEQHNGTCDYLLYVRSSDPVAKLKDPTIEVENPLLGDPDLRRIIKAQSLTFNIDAPEMHPDNRINDTKEYLPVLEMGYAVYEFTDIFTKDFSDYISSGKPYKEFPGTQRLSTDFITYLHSERIDPTLWESGEIELHFKPLKGTYGCYGHVYGSLSRKEFRQELRRNIRRRGSYIVQPKMVSPMITNMTDGNEYTYIDRVFFSSDGVTNRFMGGFRSLMPLYSVEAKNGRNHGSEHTVWAEIR